MADTVDYIFYGGTLLTIDEDCPTPEALGIKGKAIHAVGTKDHVFSFAGPQTKYVKLKGSQTLLPGFIEPHTHPIHMIEPRCSFISCSSYHYDTYKQIEEVMKKAVASVDPSSGKWCIFEGLDPLLVSDLPQLNADILDTFSCVVPILVLGACRHVSWVNHKAFEAAGITESSPDPPGGCFERDSVTNKLTGKMLEPTAWQAFLKCAPRPTAKELAQAVDEQWREYSCAGFTTITELLHEPHEEIDKAVRNKAGQVDCPIRLAVYEQITNPEDASNIKPSPICSNTNDLALNEKLWLAGIKIISDGSPRNGTCATREPFLANDKTEQFGFPPPPCYGALNYTNEELLEMMQKGHEQVKQIAVHAHGERAIEQVLDVYKKVMGNSPEARERRHRMEHLGLCEESHIIRAANLNLALSFFVDHLYFYGHCYSEYILGKERTNRWAPLSLATKHKLRWTIHQDHPAFPGPPSPFSNMKTAVTRTRRGVPDIVYGKEYRVPIEEALKAYTINAAWQIHKEKELGSLTVGKKADLVIVSENPLEVDPFRLEEIKVIDTYLDGKSNGISEKKEEIIDGRTVISYAC